VHRSSQAAGTLAFRPADTQSAHQHARTSDTFVAPSQAIEKGKEKRQATDTATMAWQGKHKHQAGLRKCSDIFKMGQCDDGLANHSKRQT
jgi:hypothetical protein